MTSSRVADPFAGFDRPFVVAHRGASSEAHENSRGAFLLAVESGASYIELDLRATVDGHLVAVHDRMVPGDPPRPVDRLTLEELDERFGSRGLILARWDDIVEEFGPQIGIDAELKQPGLESAVIRSLRAHAAHASLITSFWPQITSRVKHLEPAMSTGLIIGLVSPLIRRGRSAIQCLRLAAADTLIVHHELIGRGWSSEAQRAGLIGAAWTIDDPMEAARVISAGVRGIITNRPRQMHDKFTSNSQEPAGE